MPCREAYKIAHFCLPRAQAHMQGSMQKWLPLQQLYDKNMAYAIKQRKYWTDPVPEDDAPHQTRICKQRHADFVLCHKEEKVYMVPRIDQFIEALPDMLADTENQGLGLDETFKMRCSMGCNCVQKSGSCSGHAFDFDQYFWSWTDDNATCLNTPMSPSFPENLK